MVPGYYLKKTSLSSGRCKRPRGVPGHCQYCQPGSAATAKADLLDNSGKAGTKPLGKRGP